MKSPQELSAKRNYTISGKGKQVSTDSGGANPAML
jgi:hypothetical protein